MLLNAGQGYQVNYKDSDDFSHSEVLFVVSGNSTPKEHFQGFATLPFIRFLHSLNK